MIMGDRIMISKWIDTRVRDHNGGDGRGLFNMKRKQIADESEHDEY